MFLWKLVFQPRPTTARVYVNLPEGIQCFPCLAEEMLIFDTATWLGGFLWNAAGARCAMPNCAQRSGRQVTRITWAGAAGGGDREAIFTTALMEDRYMTLACDISQLQLNFGVLAFWACNYNFFFNIHTVTYYLYYNWLKASWRISHAISSV